MRVIRFIPIMLMILLIACDNGVDSLNSQEPNFANSSEFSWDAILKEHGLTALKMPKIEQGLSKQHYDVQEYYVKKGCFLSTKAIYKKKGSKNKNVIINASLEVKPGALPEDKTLSMMLDDELLAGSVDIVFDPHIEEFNPVALLNIDMKGLDLSGIDEEDVRIVYYDPTNNGIEDMKYEKLEIDVKKGRINLINAEIPHFSRYIWLR